MSTWKCFWSARTDLRGTVILGGEAHAVVLMEAGGKVGSELLGGHSLAVQHEEVRPIEQSRLFAPQLVGEPFEDRKDEDDVPDD